MNDLRVGPADLREWCLEHLSAEPEVELFRTGHLSTVLGLRLTDGRELVVKIRACQRRLAGCFEVQRHLFRSGFPCPEPLIGPMAVDSLLCISAEQLVTGGFPAPVHRRDPLLYVAPLARLVALATPLASRVDLEPKPSWNRWDHTEDGIWPNAEDADRPLNEVEGPRWLDEAGQLAQSYLAAAAGPLVIGHGDWYRENLRWRDDTLHVAHDWDSTIVEHESVIVGFAASDYIQPSLEETSAFISTYQEVAERRFSVEETQQSWAAGLWLKAFNAKKQLARNEPLDALSPAMAERFIRQITT